MENWIKKTKEGFLPVLVTAIKDSTTSIRKDANGLKVYEKTVSQANKLDLSPDLDLLDYVVWSVLENKTSNLNFGSLKTAIEEEWNKMSVKFMLKSCQAYLLYTIKWFQVLLCIPSNSIKHQTVLFVPIQFCISHLFAHSLNVKLF